MTAATPRHSKLSPLSSRPGIFGRIVRETVRPFRLRTWRRLAGIRESSPVKRAPQKATASEEKPIAVRRSIPSMITGEEAEYFARCAERCVRLDGKIVDLGCWMGSTAVALANG